MKLILQKDVKNLGKAGDTVKVKDGHARNYLIPEGLALVLNEGRLKDFKHKQNIIKTRKKQAVTDRAALLEKIAGVFVSFEKESHGDGHLFGSVNSTEISKALEKEHKLFVDKKDILSDPIKSVGEHMVTISLDAENKTELKVVVSKKVTKESGSEQKSKKSFFSVGGLFSKKTTTEDGEDSTLEQSPTPKQDLADKEDSNQDPSSEENS